jgi:hypothetical protein
MSDYQSPFTATSNLLLYPQQVDLNLEVLVGQLFTNWAARRGTDFGC